ncbi:hypothetical protein BGX27_004220, partial [Mortierella sp. AM989]
SYYKLVDLTAFGFALTGSIDQLIVIWSNSSGRGNPVIMSLAGFLHGSSALFELQPCPKTAETGFPLELIKAIVTTLFFAGGRYDPVEDLFNSDNYAFFLLMIIYFVVTGILTVNLLIAWVNAAYNRGEETWHQVWLESRLRCVETAENISYFIPGFRETSGWFPEEIYYTVPQKEINKFKKATEDLQAEATPSKPIDVTKEESKEKASSERMIKSTTKDTNNDMESTIDELNVKLKVKGDKTMRETQQSREQSCLIGSSKEQVQPLETRMEKLLQEQKAAMKEQGAAMEEQKETIEEQKAAIEKQKVAMEEHKEVILEQMTTIGEQMKQIENMQKAILAILNKT